MYNSRQLLCLGVILTLLPTARAQTTASNKLPGSGTVSTRPMISNGIVQLDFDQHPQYGVEFQTLSNQITGAQVQLYPSDLWELELFDPIAKTSTMISTSNELPCAINCASVSPASCTEGPGWKFSMSWTSTTLTCTWDQVDSGLGIGTATIILIAEAKPNDAAISFTLEVDTAMPTHSLLRSSIVLSVAGVDDADNEVLAASRRGGVLYYQPRAANADITNLSACTIDASVVGEFNSNPGVWSMQWAALYSTDPAVDDVLFWGTRDGQGHPKPYRQQTNGGGGQEGDYLSFIVDHFPMNNTISNNDMTMPFDVVLSPLQGDWYDAAKFYRQWARQQIWTAAGRVVENQEFSSLIKDADVVGMWSVAPCDASCAGADSTTIDFTHFQYWPEEWAEFKSLLGIDSIVPMFHHWDRDSFGSNDWGSWYSSGNWNVRPQFKWHVPADANGSYALYFNSLIYTQGADGWNSSYVPGYSQSVADFAVTDVYGMKSTDTAMYQTKDVSCGSGSACSLSSSDYLLCLGTPFPKDYTLDAGARMINDITLITQAVHGQGQLMKGMYLDVYHQDSHLCYDPSHGHPIGGGNYWTIGKLDLVDAIKTQARYSIPDFFVFMENYNEAMIGQVELNFSAALGEGNLRAFQDGSTSVARAPLFEAVYNDYIMGADLIPINAPSNLSSPDLALDVRLKIAVGATIGLVAPGGTTLSSETLMDNYTANIENTLLVDMLRDYLALLQRQDVRLYQRFGEKLRDPMTTANTISFLNADNPPNILLYSMEQPVIYAGAFQHALSNVADVGIVLANWTDEGDCSAYGGALFSNCSQVAPGDQTIDVMFDPQDYGFSMGTMLDIVEITTAGDVPVMSTFWQGGMVTIPQLTMPMRNLRFLTIQDGNLKPSKI